MSEVVRLATNANIPLRLAGIVAFRAVSAGVGLRTLRSADRHEHLVRIRQRIAYEARQSGFSLWQIGRALNRDHNTIMYSIKAEAGRRPANNTAPHCGGGL